MGPLEGAWGVGPRHPVAAIRLPRSRTNCLSAISLETKLTSSASDEVRGPSPLLPHQSPADILTKLPSLPDQPHRRYNKADPQRGRVQRQAPAFEYPGGAPGNRPEVCSATVRPTPAGFFLA